MKSKGRKRKRVRIDPYHKAQAAQLKAANLARQEVLKKERADALGDPVRSESTPFMESIRTLKQPSSQTPSEGSKYRNFFVDSDELSKALSHSKYLTEPLPGTEKILPSDSGETTVEAREKARERYLAEHQVEHDNAQKALERITSLVNASSKDKTRVNIQRCIDEFGRHRTDEVLPPRPQGPAQLATPPPEHPRLRAGPDTGSSEVQVAILTTKIDKLADHVAKVGHKDKHNKRNLRVLVHRRQKLLAYLRQKERGGPRWSNLMEKLGLSDGAWKGEISL